MIIMDRGPSLYLKLQIIGLFSIIVSAGSSTHLHGSPSGLQKRSINNNECIALEVPTNQELNEFGKAFTELSLGLNNIPDNFTGDVILFVGNTGVGKSSLVHLLAGEGANFEAQEDGVDSGNYYIVDVSGKFVSNTTIDSTTMYPEAVVDTESGAVLFDTPGFRDTRSAIHEIVATYGLHKVARMSQRVKIALLVNYNSLTPLGTRDDFTNTLESFFNMFNNTEKFQDSTYLIATKTENRFIVRKGQIIPVSPETHIKGVVQFMNGVSQTLENRKGKYGDEKFIKNAQMLIDSLKEKVALFMKPDQSGPITESIPLQQSLKNIRDMLFNDDGYIAVEEDDIGFAVSDKARIYMRNLYDLMNSHVEEVGKSFVKPFEKFLTDQAKGVDNIEEIQSSLKHIEQQVEILLKKSNISSNPSEYIDSVTNFVKSVKSMEFCSNIVVDDIKKLDGYLGALEKLTNHHHYTPREWSESFHPLKELVQHEIAYYNFLENLYKTITSHPVMFTDPTIHAIKTRNGPFRWNNVEELKDFTNHLGLTSVGNLQITAERLAELGGFVKNVVGKQSVFCYKSHTLMIVDNVLRTSDLLDQKTMSTCHPSITTVVLVATRKLYIDANLVVQGKNLVVIAPEWHTLGHFSLSVDGESGTNQNLGKAALGREGMVGKHGKPAGRFLGVGLKFFNSHWLTISAMGGNGGRGQDGGDGADGRDGRDGTHRSRIDDSSSIYVFYNTWKRLYLIKADYGTDGGDAGPGGYGGSPGSPGKVEMFSLSKNSPDRSTHRAHYGARGEDGANGRPGKGGLRGCDIIEEEYERRILFFPAGTKRESSFQNCRRRNFDGRLKPRVLSSRPDLVPSPPKPPHLQEVFGAVKQHFEAYDDIVSHAGNVEFHEAFCMQFVC